MSTDSLLCLDRVSKSYWRGAHEIVVLDGVSLQVNAGELVAVWGQRGAGKTTLALIAAGLEAPRSGTVRFAGTTLDARGSDAPRLRGGIGWVQRIGPHSGEMRIVADYVALPLLGRHSPRDARRLATAMLARVGVAECASSRWASLTDGERTLVAIAHALVREPRLLVADDPTANLSVLQREEVLGLLRQAADEEGLGILITVPDMPDVAYADKVASLSDGVLVVSQASPRRRDNVFHLRPREQSG